MLFLPACGRKAGAARRLAGDAYCTRSDHSGNGAALCLAFALKMSSDDPMMLIESEEGLLFRGPEVMNPSETWDHPRKRWVPFYPERQSVYEGWAHEIDEVRAEQLKVKNASAEHYLYYDVGPWVPPYDPANRPDPPEWVKELIAERAKKQGS